MQTASATNLAIDLVRRAEADFEAMLQRPPQYPAYKYPTGSLPFLIFKLHLPGYCDGQFDLNKPGQVIICGCPACDFLLYVPWAMAREYVGNLKEHPPTFPSSKNNFRVQVPPMYGERVTHLSLFHAQNPSQKAVT